MFRNVSVKNPQTHLGTLFVPKLQYVSGYLETLQCSRFAPSPTRQTDHPAG